MSDSVKKWHEMKEESKNPITKDKSANKQTERLNEVAEKVADVIMEMMHKSVDWQISDFNTDGDEHCAIHDTVVWLVLKKLSKKIR